MPELPHLILPRLEYEEARRKRKGYGSLPEREFSTQGQKLIEQVDTVLDLFKSRQKPAFDPNLVLRVQLNPKAILNETAWERCGLTLLSYDNNKTLVLFSSDVELTEFRRKLNEYKEGPKKHDQKNAPYNQLFASIDEIGEVRPKDRIGRLFLKNGIEEIDDFDETSNYVIDIELWVFIDKVRNERNFDNINKLINEKGGRITDHYLSETLILIRSKCTGKIIKELLTMDCISEIDLPPSPGLNVSGMLNIGISELLPVPAPKPGAPCIAVLDSGLTSGHPLLAPAVGEATCVPSSIGDPSDEHGHGTMVAGIALYGDVEYCISNRSFIPQLTLYSARVLNRYNAFDDENLIITQMRQSIEYFNSIYNCKVFNLSLGDERLPYHDGKISPWASILDTLARELDIVIIVSAGNYIISHDVSKPVETCLQEYPNYLTSEEARIIEPATGAIVLTVGSLAKSSGIAPELTNENVTLRPIAATNQPSPFTRRGPGLDRSIKPELCDYGGNTAFDGHLQCERDDIQELSMISLNRIYIERLFRTVVGTSFAAPKIAHIAALLYGCFPNATANLIRALLVCSASVPSEASDLLSTIDKRSVLQICGYGKPNFELASSSSESRVVLYSESKIEFDRFHLYELPIPPDFRLENGTRKISISLAFDPPVRHTRIDYLGVSMSFRLIRGKTIEEIVEAYRHRNSTEAQIEKFPQKYICKMEPTPTIREGGTLQKAIHTMYHSPDPLYGDSYYLVVNCEKIWAHEEHNPQRHAVVAVIEQSAQVNIYSTIRERVESRLRVRPLA